MIGCLAAFLLLVAVIVGFGLWGISIMESTKVEVAGQLELDVTEARDEGRISPEEASAFLALAVTLKAPETQPFAAFAVIGLFENLLESDGDERAQLLEAANDLNKFLSREESPGMVELIEFVQEHPTLSEMEDFEYSADKNDGEHSATKRVHFRWDAQR